MGPPYPCSLYPVNPTPFISPLLPLSPFSDPRFFLSLILNPSLLLLGQVSTQSEKEKEIEDRLPITSSRNGEMYSAFYNVTAMVDTGVVSLPELG
ncbi:Lysine histidine transporter-like 2 [Acorus calamus]|uniref:Lysine histidine transporter-like 2 n=1 Tax=Acorus calamus TaxID=4465 RepID=A0AAV9EPZ6_ACOCL|nr:Lysine histidine transporter-like 2 [Acorus calamus]